MNESTKPHKGPFWVINEETCSLIAYPVDIKVNPVPSHKNAWEWAAGISLKNKPWNYYPRGRVEIRRDKAVIFANPKCYEWQGLEENIRRDFCLDDMKIVFKTDNSSHYQFLNQ